MLLLVRRTTSNQALLEPPYLDNHIWAAVGFAFIAIAISMAYWGIAYLKKDSLWPSIPDTDGTVPEDLALIAEAAHTLSECWNTPWHLAPTHKLAGCIQNLHARIDAANGQPQLHLRQILDSLMLCYAHVSPFSIYSQTPRVSVWPSYRQLQTLLPQLRNRMDERDDEYLLMPPHIKS